MSILDRAALEQSPLADLHAIASELSLDGYRRLRKAALIDAILERQGGAAGPQAGNGDPGAAADAPSAGEPDAGAADAPSAGEPDAGALESGATDEGDAGAAVAAVADDGARSADEGARSAGAAAEEEDTAGSRRRRGRRGGRSRTREDAGEPERTARDRGPDEGAEASGETPAGDRAAAPVAEGVVEVLANGSGFLRVSPPEPSDDDIYISAAQVKRCELVSGDRISGPRRAPRRSERFASLVRIDTINGQPASEMADSARFDDLPAGFPVERWRLGSDEPTLKAIEFLTPLGRGSRVTIVGPAQAGKTEALRLLVQALAGVEDVHVLLALAGVRPEEVPSWSEGPLEPTAVASLTASADAQGQAVERVVDQGRRLAARGNHVVVIIDSLAGLSHGGARKALAAARRIVDGGSLTVIATAPEPLGGETTVIALDGALTAARRFPALDLAASWTMHPELLVGEEGAELIVRTRAEALGA